MLARTTAHTLAWREPVHVVARCAGPASCSDRRLRATARAAPGPDVAYMTRQEQALAPEWPAESSNQILQWQPRVAQAPAMPTTPASLPLPAPSSLPLVVDGQGKSSEQVVERLRQLLPFQHTVLATRVGAMVAQQVLAQFPGAKYQSRGRVLLVRSEQSNKKAPKVPGTVCVVSGSVVDEGLAEECRLVAEHLGCYCYQLRNTRLSFVDGQPAMSNLEALQSADVVIVVSGHDVTLPGWLASLVDSPVIAVPMVDGQDAGNLLRTAGPGAFSVVNVDDGQGAAFMALRILRQAAKLRTALQAHSAATATSPAVPPAAAPPPSANIASTQAHNGHSVVVAAASVAINGIEANGVAVAMGPRCAWPQAKRLAGHAAPAADAVPSTSAQSNGHAHATDLLKAAAAVTGPRCAWPSTKHASAAPSTSAPANGHAVETPAMAMGPRCAWPSTKHANGHPGPSASTSAAANGNATAGESQELVAILGPRCAWPSTKHANGHSTATGAAAANGHAMAGEAASAAVPIMGPRSAWPSAKYSPSFLTSAPSTPGSINGHAVAGELTAPANVMGPQCAWPSPKHANSHIAAAAPAPAPMSEPVTSGDQGAAEMGPRCAWPQAKPVNGQAVPAAVSGQQISTASGDQEVVPMGPRCAWPRKLAKQ